MSTPDTPADPRPQLYAVNDAYASVQGEGVKTGVPMVFLRLHGCGVGCVFCDTKETWAKDSRHRVLALEDALGANPKWTIARAGDIALCLATRFPGPRWCLVTGGEPAEQDLGPLVAALYDCFSGVAVETSGTAPGVLNCGACWVTLSPKVGMPGGKAILPEVVRVADEIKWVVGAQRDLDALDAFLVEHAVPPQIPVCLQPMSANPKATQLCTETAIRRAWRLSVQTHKLLGLR